MGGFGGGKGGRSLPGVPFLGHVAPFPAESDEPKVRRGRRAWSIQGSVYPLLHDHVGHPPAKGGAGMPVFTEVAHRRARLPGSCLSACAGSRACQGLRPKGLESSTCVRWVSNLKGESTYDLISLYTGKGGCKLPSGKAVIPTLRGGCPFSVDLARYLASVCFRFSDFVKTRAEIYSKKKMVT